MAAKHKHKLSLPTVIPLILVIIGVVVGILYLNRPTNNFPKAAPSSPTFRAYDSHPNYWAAGSNRWTAKKYGLVKGSRDPGYGTTWVWSGPGDGNSRILRYQRYDNHNPSEIMEWEKWSGNPGGRAKVQAYGAKTEAGAYKVYPTRTDCLNNTSIGVEWPDLGQNEDFQVVGQSLKYPSNYCTTAYSPDKPNGDYIAVKLVESWDQPQSATRNSYCRGWFPDPENIHARKICQTSPKVGIVQQRYVASKDAKASGPKFLHGCEMTIYAWGNEYSNNNQFRNWFDNGELRYTNYLNLGQYDSVKAPNDEDWWTSQCTDNRNRTAWDAVPNWFYTGVYKLTNTEYHP